MCRHKHVDRKCMDAAFTMIVHWQLLLCSHCGQEADCWILEYRRSQINTCLVCSFALHVIFTVWLHFFCYVCVPNSWHMYLLDFCKILAGWWHYRQYMALWNLDWSPVSILSRIETGSSHSIQGFHWICYAEDLTLEATDLHYNYSIIEICVWGSHATL